MGLTTLQTVRVIPESDYYYIYGNCIMEQRHIGDCFELTNGEVEMSLEEEYLILKGAEKVMYKDKDKKI